MSIKVKKKKAARICKRCGRSYRTSGYKFCGISCATAAETDAKIRYEDKRKAVQKKKREALRVVPCIVCKRIFDPLGPAHRYCTPACRAIGAERAARKKREKIKGVSD